jgi:hypothetical protein
MVGRHRQPVESNVQFHFASNPGSALESALATSSPGIKAYYLAQSDTGIFRATDATDAKYVGYMPSREYIVRTGNVIDVFESGARMGTPPRGCESVPLIAVECSGTTTIDR